MRARALRVRQPRPRLELSVSENPGGVNLVATLQGGHEIPEAPELRAGRRMGLEVPDERHADVAAVRLRAARVRALVANRAALPDLAARADQVVIAKVRPAAFPLVVTLDLSQVRADLSVGARARIVSLARVVNRDAPAATSMLSNR